MQVPLQTVLDSNFFCQLVVDESSMVCCDLGAGRATVAKLQVGLLGSARSLQRDLERIAGRADTNTPDGLHYVLQGTCYCLLLLSMCLWVHAFSRCACIAEERQ